MKRLLLGFCILSVFTVVHAESFARNNMLIWGTLDNRSYIDTAVEAVGVKGADIEVYDAVINFKRFCSGLDGSHPDAVVVSRNMTVPELERCRDNGVTDVLRIKMGDEAIVLAADKSAKPIALSPQILWRASSRDIFEVEMDSSSPIVENPHEKWSDLDDKLPNIPIQLLVPAKDDGALYNSFKVLGMEAGCRKYEWIEVMKFHRHFRTHYKALCYRTRTDGVVSSVSEKEGSMAERIVANKNSIGVLSFSDWTKGEDRLRALTIDNVAPTIESIGDGSYPLARPHYIFIKKANLKLVRGLKKLVDGLGSEAAIGKTGYLTKMDLVQTGAPQQTKTKVAMPVKKEKEK